MPEIFHAIRLERFFLNGWNFPGSLATDWVQVAKVGDVVLTCLTIGHTTVVFAMPDLLVIIVLLVPCKPCSRLALSDKMGKTHSRTFCSATAALRRLQNFLGMVSMSCTCHVVDDITWKQRDLLSGCPSGCILPEKRGAKVSNRWSLLRSLTANLLVHLACWADTLQ